MKKIINILLAGFAITSSFQSVSANWPLSKHQSVVEIKNQGNLNIQKSFKSDLEQVIFLINDSAKIFNSSAKYVSKMAEGHRDDIGIKADENEIKEIKAVIGEYPYLLQNIKMANTPEFLRINNVDQFNEKFLELLENHLVLSIDKKEFIMDEFYKKYCHPSSYCGANFKDMYDEFLTKVHDSYNKVEEQVAREIRTDTKYTNKDYLGGLYDYQKYLKKSDDEYKQNLKMTENALKVVSHGYKILKKIPIRTRQEAEGVIKISITLRQIYSIATRMMMKHSYLYSKAMSDLGYYMREENNIYLDKNYESMYSMLNIQENRYNLFNFRNFSNMSRLEELCNERFWNSLNLDNTNLQFEKYLCLAKAKERLQGLSLILKNNRSKLDANKRDTFFKEKQDEFNKKSAEVYVAAVGFKVFFSNFLYHSVISNIALNYKAMLEGIKASKLVSEAMSKYEWIRSFDINKIRELKDLSFEQLNTYIFNSALERQYVMWIKNLQYSNEKNISTMHNFFEISAEEELMHQGTNMQGHYYVNNEYAMDACKTLIAESQIDFTEIYQRQPFSSTQNVDATQINPNNYIIKNIFAVKEPINKGRDFTANYCQEVLFSSEPMRSVAQDYVVKEFLDRIEYIFEYGEDSLSDKIIKNHKALDALHDGLYREHFDNYDFSIAGKLHGYSIQNKYKKIDARKYKNY